MTISIFSFQIRASCMLNAAIWYMSQKGIELNGWYVSEGMMNAKPESFQNI